MTDSLDIETDQNPNPFATPAKRALTPDSAAAIDAVLGGENRPNASPAHLRAARGILALLEPPESAQGGPFRIADDSEADLLIDLTLSRVLGAAEHGLAGRIHARRSSPRLSHAAAAELDRLVESGWERGDDASASALCDLLEARADSAERVDQLDLVERTFARVRSQGDAHTLRFRMDPVEPMLRRRPTWRWSDLISAAAMILVGVSVIWPMLTGVRHLNTETACAAGLARTAAGFTLYAADSNGALPQAQASFLGGQWWNVGKRGQSHSANLYRLVGGSYASLAELACPGNRAAPTVRRHPGESDWHAPEEVSYSYQLFGPGRPQWNQGASFVVLVDRSSVVARSRLGERFNPDAASVNHPGRGQNVLFSDGHVRFLTTPVLPNGDNLWLPESVRVHTLTGREVPTTDRDAFVGP